MFFETLKEFIRQAIRGPLEIPIAIIVGLSVTVGVDCLIHFFPTVACVLSIALVPVLMFFMGSRFFGYACTRSSFMSLYALFFAIYSACLPAYLHHDHHAHSWTYNAFLVQLVLFCLFFLVCLLYWVVRRLVLWFKKSWGRASWTVHTRHGSSR